MTDLPLSKLPPPPENDSRSSKRLPQDIRLWQLSIWFCRYRCAFLLRLEEVEWELLQQDMTWRFESKLQENVTLPNLKILSDVMALIIRLQGSDQKISNNKGILIVPEVVGNILVMAYSGRKSTFTSSIPKLPEEKCYVHDPASH